MADDEKTKTDVYDLDGCYRSDYVWIRMDLENTMTQPYIMRLMGAEQKLAMRIIAGTDRVHFPSEMGTGITMAPFLWAQRTGQAGLIYMICPASLREYKQHDIQKLTHLTTEVVIGSKHPLSGAQVVIMTPESLRLRYSELHSPYMVVTHCVQGSWISISAICGKATKVVLFTCKQSSIIDSIINGD